MGFESALRFSYPDEARVREVLCAVPTMRALPDGPLELRTLHGPGDWPDASLSIHPWGVLFCDHGGPLGGQGIVAVTAALRAAFGAVTVDDDV